MENAILMLLKKEGQEQASAQPVNCEIYLRGNSETHQYWLVALDPTTLKETWFDNGWSVSNPNEAAEYLIKRAPADVNHE